MRAGSFFKMVDSPFKLSIMNAYDKKMGGGGTVAAQSVIAGGP